MLTKRGVILIIPPFFEPDLTYAIKAMLSFLLHSFG